MPCGSKRAYGTGQASAGEMAFLVPKGAENEVKKMSMDIRCFYLLAASSLSSFCTLKTEFRDFPGNPMVRLGFCTFTSGTRV